MLASPEYISLAIKLGQKNLFRTFHSGAYLVRGYADLGHEEFILIGAGKLCSIYTGSASAMPEGHEKFFYRVPSIEEITDIILRRNFDIKEVLFKDQRIWRIGAQHIESKKQLIEEHREFECAIANLLLAILTHENE